MAGSNKLHWLIFLQFVLVMPSPAQTVTHGLSQKKPTAAQIQAFCMAYPKTNGKYKKTYYKQYQSYCGNQNQAPGLSQNKPTPQGQNTPVTTIRQLHLPVCLSKGSLIQVAGDYLSSGKIRCYFTPKLGLRLRSQNPKEQQFLLSDTPLPQTTYRLSCQTGKQSLVSQPVKSCSSNKPTIQTTVQQTTGKQTIDLAGSLALISPVQTTAGNSQNIKIDYRNLGTGQSQQRFAIELILSKQSLRQGRKPRLSKNILTNNIIARKILQGQPVPTPGLLQSVFATVRLPAALEPGNYYWCLRLDSTARIKESNENNNSSCRAQAMATKSAAKTGLSGVFGSRLRNKKPRGKLPKNVAGNDNQGNQGPDRLPGNGKLTPLGAASALSKTKKIRIRQLIQTLPANLQTLDGEVPLLSLNDDILGPIDIAATGPARLSWTVPAMAGDRMYLVISTSNIDSCPSGPVEAHRAELTALSVLDSTSGIKPLTGNSDLNLVAYSSGQTYFLWGCVVRAGELTGIQTNRLTMHFAFPVINGLPDLADISSLPRLTDIPRLPNLSDIVRPPDLVVRQFRRLGSDRLFFWVQATTRAPEGQFPWTIYVIDPFRFAELDSPADLAGLTSEAGVRIYRGEGHVQNLGLFGFGDAITVPVNIPEGLTWVVILQINQPVGPRGPDPSTGRHYRESNYGNNSASLRIGDQYTAFPNLFIDLNVVRSGRGWAVFDLHYIQHTHAGTYISLRLPSQTDRRAEISCVNMPDNQPRVLGYAGEHVVRFYCLRPEGQANRGSVALARMTGWPPDNRQLTRKVFPTGLLPWGAGNRGTGLPDLVARIQHLETGPAGFGGNAVVEISNLGDTVATHVAGNFSLKNNGPYGAVRGQQTLLFTRIEPGQTVSRRVSLSTRLVAVNHSRARWTVDPENQIMESDETNNRAEQVMPAGPTSGRFAVPLTGTATGKQTTFHRDGLCILAVGGHAWPSEMRMPATGNVLVGYRSEYSEGVCSSRWVFDAYGFLDFDLEPYRSLGSNLRSATLRFERTGAPPVVHRDYYCRGNYVTLVAAALSDWRSRAPEFSLRTDPSPGTRAITADHGAEFDVTGIVRQWLNGESSRYGFLLKGSSGRRNNLTMNCAAYYGNFTLTLQIGE